ncbi:MULTISPECIES: deoxynucleoside kinase [Marinifilum]|uniref:Deoxyadenosine/deoxycytidine kinase n=1 Tax=Marinifilum flexuosum TaxID=1117708 RepID=A0A419X6L9_9BACT|nr:MULTISPECIES: deoxynucleoside kinase [Marinifilum]MCY1636089.1 deoxynucleoside kinase [Marinifilum sp. D737]MDQ2179572.1 deoxynucleoside kinase [Marinifilum sp. D714]RKE03335.1 deoxyadenosine/deoxycytidine kinase [Marinifilum flexuosum]
MHIAVAGNIGSGKTTLTELLAKHYKWEAHYEDVDENPYLNDFYDDMQRWSFNLQIYFLKSRFTQIMDIRNSGKNVVQDRTIFEDAKIFAPNLYDMGLMSERDFKNYCNLFQLMSSMVQAPDLLIYLRSSVPTLVNQIQKRGRDYEETIRLDYLKNLNNRYENWISNYNNGNLLIVDADNIDFLENPADLNSIVDKVEAKIHGLF